jgi:hypothetical protein
MFKIGEANVPSKCPTHCPEKMKFYKPENLCSVCPVLTKDPNYREDWAKEFEKWFKGGMVGYPKLKL